MQLKKTFQKLKLKRFIKEKGFWYIDIPRTSSSSTRLSLKKMFGKYYGKSNIFEKELSQESFYKGHLTNSECLLFFGEKLWKNINKFTIVRNSWSRFYSIYGYLQKAKVIEEDLKFPKFIEQAYETFSNKKSKLKLWPKIIYPAVSFLKRPDGSIDDSIKIINFENREKELKEYFGEFNIEFKSDKKIMSSDLKKNYREAYDNLSKDLVSKMFSEDIARFDHEF
tara:strand:+ start:123 stop:794 length:672 start_codon:yes stop_codon:yes gene_type:complete